jgi:hypothetical protein
LQFVRRFRSPTIGRFRRALLGIAAVLGYFAMLGVGDGSKPVPRVDVVAHAAGLGFGVLAGVLAGLSLRRPVGTLGQAIALLATLTTLSGAWLLAFRGHL